MSFDWIPYEIELSRSRSREMQPRTNYVRFNEREMCSVSHGRAVEAVTIMRIRGDDLSTATKMPENPRALFLALIRPFVSNQNGIIFCRPRSTDFLRFIIFPRPLGRFYSFFLLFRTLGFAAAALAGLVIANLLVRSCLCV